MHVFDISQTEGEPLDEDLDAVRPKLLDIAEHLRTPGKNYFFYP